MAERYVKVFVPADGSIHSPKIEYQTSSGSLTTLSVTDTNNATDNNVITFPGKSGTVALVSDIGSTGGTMTGITAGQGILISGNPHVNPTIGLTFDPTTHATTTFVTSELAKKAPTDSPTFTGTITHTGQYTTNTSVLVTQTAAAQYIGNWSSLNRYGIGSGASGRTVVIGECDAGGAWTGSTANIDLVLGVNPVWHAGNFNLSNVHGIGSTAQKPAPSLSNVGYLYYDTIAKSLQRSNGTSWVDYGGQGSGGDIQEAPTDGGIYGRKNSSWTALPKGNVYYASDYVIGTGNGTTNQFALTAEAVVDSILNIDSLKIDGTSIYTFTRSNKLSTGVISWGNGADATAANVAITNPVGTTTGVAKVTFTSNVGRLSQSTGLGSSAGVYSIYLRADAPTQIWIGTNNGSTWASGPGLLCTLTTEWQRFTLSIPGNMSLVLIGTADPTNVGLTGLSARAVYTWGAQVEQRDTPTDWLDYGTTITSGYSRVSNRVVSLATPLPSTKVLTWSGTYTSSAGATSASLTVGDAPSDGVTYGRNNGSWVSTNIPPMAGKAGTFLGTNGTKSEWTIPSPYFDNIVMLPYATANTTSLGTITASSKGPDVQTLQDPWMAFSTDTTVNKYGHIFAGSTPSWIQYKFNAPRRLVQYGIVPWSIDSWPGRLFTKWNLSGSNDGITWFLLDDRTAVSTDWTANTENKYNIAVPGFYLYYRVNIITQVGNPYMAIQRVRFYENEKQPWIALSDLADDAPKDSKLYGRRDGMWSATSMGGSYDYLLSVTESFNDLSNWTQKSGTWTASNATGIISTPGAVSYIQYKTPIDVSAGFAFEADFKLSSLGGSDPRAGIAITDSNIAVPYKLCLGLVNRAGSGTGKLGIVNDGTAWLYTSSNSYWSADTWVTLKVVVGLNNLTNIYINGVLVERINSASASFNIPVTPYVNIFANDCTLNIKNLKIWNLSYNSIPGTGGIGLTGAVVGTSSATLPANSNVVPPASAWVPDFNAVSYANQLKVTELTYTPTKVGNTIFVKGMQSVHMSGVGYYYADVMVNETTAISGATTSYYSSHSTPHDAAAPIQGTYVVTSLNPIKISLIGVWRSSNGSRTNNWINSASLLIEETNPTGKAGTVQVSSLALSNGGGQTTIARNSSNTSYTTTLPDKSGTLALTSDISYSTSETLTGGTWIDGSLIYRKTINFGALPSSATKTVASGIVGLNKIIRIGGTSSSTTQTINLPHIDPAALTNSVRLLFERSTSEVSITTAASSWTAFTDTYVTIEYTKV